MDLIAIHRYLQSRALPIAAFLAVEVAALYLGFFAWALAFAACGAVAALAHVAIFSLPCQSAIRSLISHVSRRPNKCAASDASIIRWSYGAFGMVLIALFVCFGRISDWAYSTGQFGEPRGNRVVECHGGTISFRARQVAIEAPVVIGFAYEGKIRSVKYDEGLDTSEYTGDYYWECGESNGRHGCDGEMRVLESGGGRFLLQIMCPNTVEFGCFLKLNGHGTITFTDFFFGSPRDIHPWDCSRMRCPSNSSDEYCHIDIKR